MAYENLNFRKYNMTYDSGYFYMIDDDWDALVQKLPDGDNAFSYPLSKLIGGTPYSLEYDGVNFWTLQEEGPGGIRIRRWKVENEICELKFGFVKSTYDSEAFTVEHYHDTFSTVASGGDTNVTLNLYDDSLVASGIVLTLGPNDINQSEEVDVVSVSGSTVTLSSGIQYTYDAGDSIQFYNNLWVFDNTGAGELHKLNAYTGDEIITYSGSLYDDVTAATFHRVRGVTSSRVDALIYLKDTNLRYLNPNNVALYGVMLIDNIETDNSTIIKVYDIAISGNNIFRLQKGATYYETDYVWTYYNYVLSTVRRFIDVVSISAYPLILPANGVNVTEATAIVTDQYGDGIVNKPVFFTDTDDVGFMTISPAYTDIFFGTGEAVSYYKAGVTVDTVTITATATQYD